MLQASSSHSSGHRSKLLLQPGHHLPPKVAVDQTSWERRVRRKHGRGGLILPGTERKKKKDKKELVQTPNSEYWSMGGVSAEAGLEESGGV